MKAGKLKTLSIVVFSVLATANTCSKAVIRRMLGNISRPWVDKTMQKWVDQVLKLVGVNVNVYNPTEAKPIKGKPTIIMCNHSSLYDIPISIKAFPNASIRMLSKKEISRVPIMAGGMHAAEFPFIDRKNRKQAIKDLEAVKKLMETGIVVWIAPEGTRSKDGKLAKFKKGGFIIAIESGATIIPIGIRGAFDILPARTKRFNINQQAEVHIGKAIDASEYSLENREELIEKTYQEMKKLVGEN
jgi:1-acyl-sn-glycerol-3-phosphate acyltransferase